MINSRNLEELLPPVKKRAEALLEAAKAQGIDLLVTSTYRDNECQTLLYAQGRTKPGDIVTNAKAGESYHNYRCAFDVVPLVNGKPVWNAKDPVWQKIGAIGKSCDLEWAGDWVGKMREMAHFQYANKLTIAQLQAGAKIT
jgi:peptidoglycan L-alanyl-D-glutamate endopeptidase CwlK